MQIADRIGDYSVDLFRHCTVARAQARFHMCDGQMQLLGSQGAGGGRVHVTNDRNERWPRLDQELFVGDDDSTELLPVRASTDAERVIRLRQAEIAEENVRHDVVVVLTRMHEDWNAPGPAFALMVQLRDRHEV